MQIIVLLGPPASGKGTQSAFLEHLGFQPFSFGKYMREKAAEGDPRFVAAKKIADTGALVSDELVNEVLENFILEKKQQGFRGVILDGSPRTVKQAELLDQLIARQRLSLKIIELDVPEAELNNRRLKRVADALARNEAPRDDDGEDVFLNRLAVYRNQTVPVCAYYARQPGRLAVVNAGTSPQHTWAQIQAALALKPAAPRPPAP
jgi:adenylate kinase